MRALIGEWKVFFTDEAGLRKSLVEVAGGAEMT
jgi:hypothetical protein